MFLAACFVLLGCEAQDKAAPEKMKEIIEPVNYAEKATPIEQVHMEQHKERVLLDVPLIKQNPELKFGCEVTSLAMVLQSAGFNVDKMTLAHQIAKDPDPVVKSRSGDIVKWGNPDHGFVGDITGRSMGYAVSAGPTEKLMKKYLPKRTVNLTGKPFDELLNQLGRGKPVLVWTTGDYKLPDRLESWKHGSETIKAPLDLHAVVLVGYDPQNVYVNDPLSGRKAHKVNKRVFLGSWKALRKQALSYN
ncbi:C39 family peptidase [Falsibacillus albus]|uniref:Peptidase C39 n=1 Tax=Falsibacillus albus TaxID=2478915 RepID=A0A3L7JMU4_9BACI|nr:peptidase C39 [Falsibacillus albus]